MDFLQHFVICCIILIIYNKIILCLFGSRQRTTRYYHRMQFENIHNIVKYILNRYNIKSRHDLDTWCGGRNRKNLYDEVQKYSSGIKISLDELRKNTRSSYEALLTGYANSCNKYTIE